MKTRNAKIHQEPAKQTNQITKVLKCAKFFLQIQQIQLFHYSAVNSKPRI